MSRMWLKNGRAVLKDGRAALCDECPCETGCRYTYYVDHARATSGDGHSWETAFKSVNDVFNSLEVYNYRLSGCLITVIVRGNINYLINGNYLYFIGSSVFENYIIIKSEDPENPVTASTIGNPSGDFRFYFIEFRNISFITTLYNPYAYLQKITFSSCSFRCNWEPGTGSRSIFLFYPCNYIVFNDCTITMVLTSNLEDIVDAFAFFRCNYCEFYNLSVDIIANRTGDSLSNTATFSILDVITHCIVENITVAISGTLSQPLIIARAFRQATNCLISNLTTSYSVSSSSPSPISILYCNFYHFTDTGYTGTVFYNCAQYCKISGTAYNCASRCPELS